MPDQETGLEQLGFRYYDPNTGRFLTRDPIGTAGGANLYAYTSNNPVNYVDPLGLYREGIWDAFVYGGNDLSQSFVRTTGLSVITDPFNRWLGNDGLEDKCSKAYTAGRYGGYLYNIASIATGVVQGVKSAPAVIQNVRNAPQLAQQGTEFVLNLAKNGCFVAGTPVAMADGTTKPIEQVEDGDLVLSRDEYDDGTGAITISRVVQTTVREVASTRLVTLATGEQVETTEEHPFYVSGRGFVPARDLGIGTSIVTRAGPAVQVVGIEQKEQSATVYNVEVEGTHTYFVGLAGGGVWAHNVTCPRVLYHYTSEAGEAGILKDMAINPSLGPARNARYGSGVYLTDLAPGSKTPGQLARRIFGQPWAGRKLNRVLSIDVTGLPLENPAPSIYLVPGEAPLGITGRLL